MDTAKYKKAAPNWPTILFLITAIISGCVDGPSPADQKHHIKPRTLTLPSGEVLEFSKSATDNPVNINDWKKDNQKRARQCVESTCQLDKSILYSLDDKYYYLTEAEASKLKEEENFFDTNIWPLISRVIDKSEENDRKSYEETHIYAKNLRKSSSLQLDSTTTALAKWVHAINACKDYTWEEHFDQEHFKVNKQLSLKTSIQDSMTPTERERVKGALTIYNRYLKDHIFGSSLSIIEKVGLRQYILAVFGKEDFEISRIRFNQKIKNDLKIIDQSAPLLSAFAKKDVALQKQLRMNDLLPAEEISIYKTLLILEVFKSLIVNPWPELDHYNINMSELLSPKGVKEALDLFNQKNSGQYLRDHREASFKKTYNTCKASFSAHLASLPTREQLKRTKEFIAESKIASLNSANKVFKGNNLSEINELITDIEFNLPVAREDALATIKNDLEAFLNMTIRIPFENLNIKSQKELENLYGLFVLTAATDEEKLDDRYEEINDLCKRYLPKSLNDASITVENRIITSSKTVKSGELGIGLILHEIGHRLHKDLTEGPSMSTSECIKSRHSSERYPGVDRGAKYFKEDLADHFATTTLNDMGLNGVSNNFACLFFTDSKLAENKEKLVFYPSYTTHPLVSKENDTHSSDTFRLLQVSEDLGHMTKTCRNFVETDSSMIFDFKDGTAIITPRLLKCEGAN